MTAVLSAAPPSADHLSVASAPVPVPLHSPAPLRLVPAPTSAPPYDDELEALGAPVLRLVRPLVPVPTPARFDDEAWLASERTPTAELSSAEEFVRRMVQALVEVVAGVRPIAQLRRDTTPELYTSLRATILCRPKTTHPRPNGRAIRSVHVQQRPEGIAEACATVRRGDRITAVALRLEGVEGRWRCIELAGASRV